MIVTSAAARRRERVRLIVRRLRKWLRAPRRLRFTRAGWLFTGGALAIGVAAIPTGNNLLFLLLGSMLGFIAVSGWLSEQSIRGLELERRLPRGVTAGQPIRIAYRVRNAKRRLPILAVEIRERDLPAAPPAPAGPPRSRVAWLASLPAGDSVTLRAEHTVDRRGVYPLEELTLATGFPFGLFRKERDIELAGTLVVWPRSDRTLREVRTPGRPRQRTGELVGGGVGTRGEFRGLRDYRPGDDPRDVHWRSSARLGSPVVREYERERAETLWICVDLGRSHDADVRTEEEALEIAASLARTTIERSQPVALATSDVVIEEGSGPAQLDRILDALARAAFRIDAPTPRPPVAAAASVLVSATGRRVGGYADAFVASPTPPASDGA
ncbi:MAG TPA: DUF58 domain-containing protein [Longimicrobiales bacterium]|nr:DUF58 domain-containing protein [Longimicrobiales bacterium]